MGGGGGCCGAVVAGPAAIAAPLTTRYEYLADVSRIAAMDLGTYLRTFAWYIVDNGHGPVWAVPVSGHPPLATLLFVALAKAGLPQAGWAALCIAGGAGAAPAVLSTVRVLAGEQVARTRGAVRGRGAGRAVDRHQRRRPVRGPAG